MKPIITVLFAALFISSCATASSETAPQASLQPRTLAETVTEDDPTPEDPSWKIALDHAIRDPFASGREICVVGDATDKDPATGRETAEFAGFMILNDALGNPGIETVQSMPARKIWWLRADNRSHLVMVCVVPQKNQPTEQVAAAQ